MHFGAFLMGFELLDKRPSVLQKSIKWWRAAFLMTACATPFSRRYSQFGTCVRFLTNYMFLALFSSETAFTVIGPYGTA